MRTTPDDMDGLRDELNKAQEFATQQDEKLRTLESKHDEVTNILNGVKSAFRNCPDLDPSISVVTSADRVVRLLGKLRKDHDRLLAEGRRSRVGHGKYRSLYRASLTILHDMLANVSEVDDGDG